MRASFSLAVRGIVAAFVLAALGACQKSQSQPAAMPPPEVTVAVVRPRDLPANFEYVAQISGVREVEVRPRISGILEKWNFTEGSKVAAGQSLFTIDAAPFRAVLARAEADLVSAQASFDQAKRNAGRLKPLYEAKAVSQ
ncbi:MAG TPA: biotin/lipoyl-binding protein, partial [Burkholderiales bacterium]